MRDIELFQTALGLSLPWQVTSTEFNFEQKRLDIKIDFPKGSTFCCPKCNRSELKAYDTTEKSWRHLNFFQHDTYLITRLPRVNCPECGVHLIDSIPWARRDSGFTLLFEAMIMTLVKSMPLKTLASFVGENDTRLWRIVHHYVDKGRENADHSEVEHVGVDETASKRGHNYVSVFVDLDKSQILYATEGKDASTVKRFEEDLISHKGNPNNITEFCSDMSPSFISGVAKCFPAAHLTFDKFHIMKIINEGVDEVRRQEQKERPELSKTRYIWLKNKDNLTKTQLETLEALQMEELNLKTSRAYQIRLNFQEFFKQPKELSESYLENWYDWAIQSNLEPMKEAAYTVKRHWEGILRCFHSNLTTGMLEGFNSLIQSAKSRARGYRTNRNLIAMIYLIGGKLDFKLPT